MKSQDKSYARDVIKTRTELAQILGGAREDGLKVVFTNGCFDLIHPGHIRYLERASQLGDILVLALNSDGSVHRLKGPDRPVLTQSERAEIVAALHCVDYVTIFEEDTPRAVIEELKPNVLVKGGDWGKEEIVGRNFVEKQGGKVVVIDFEEGYSTTRIIERIRG